MELRARMGSTRLRTDPGGAWTHYSEIVGDTGFRHLSPGELVEFDREDLGREGPGQDGYSYRAMNVRRRVAR